MGDILSEKLTVDVNIVSEKITADVDLTRPLIMRLGEKGEKGEKGDQGEVDYTKVEMYVKNRVEKIFSPVGVRMDNLERKIDEKIELSDWQGA